MFFLGRLKFNFFPNNLTTYLQTTFAALFPYLFAIAKMSGCLSTFKSFIINKSEFYNCSKVNKVTGIFEKIITFDQML